MARRWSPSAYERPSTQSTASYTVQRLNDSLQWTLGRIVKIIIIRRYFVCMQKLQNIMGDVGMFASLLLE